jgi:probable DNA metabolism protein
MTLVYDGSFEGYLSLIHAVYYKKIVPKAIVKEYGSLFFEDVWFCKSESMKAQAVLDALQKKFTQKNLKTVFHIFLCDKEAFEMPLLEFIRLGFTAQENLQNIGNNAVFYIHSLEKKLLGTYHKYIGFLRFEELEEGTLYAKIETHYNILSLLGRHFSKRLHTLDFMIHDVKREFVFLHVKGEILIKKVLHCDMPKFSKNEAKMQSLWKEFFRATTINERKNEALQKGWIPLHYRVYMNEFL